MKGPRGRVRRARLVRVGAAARAAGSAPRRPSPCARVLGPCSRPVTAAVSATPIGRRMASRTNPGPPGRLTSSLVMAGLAVMTGMARPSSGCSSPVDASSRTRGTRERRKRDEELGGVVDSLAMSMPIYLQVDLMWVVVCRMRMGDSLPSGGWIRDPW